MPTHCLFEHHDAHGALYVWDDGSRRTLGFGPDDVQSVCRKADPACLQLDYTQAMLLGLLLPKIGVSSAWAWGRAAW